MDTITAILDAVAKLKTRVNRLETLEATHAATADDADTVDSIHAATTATASTLLALDADKDLHLDTGDVSGADGTFTGNLQAAAIKLTTGAGATKVLTSDADGDATWEAPAGGGDADTLDGLHATGVRGGVWYVDDTAHGDDATDDAAHIQAVIDAMEAAGGGLVMLGPKTYKIIGGLTMTKGCLRGQGLVSCLHGSAQTGPVLDLTGYTLGGDNFKLGNDIGGFQVRGDNTADATKVHQGIHIEGGGNGVTGLHLHDMSISETGGAGLYMTTETDCNHLERVTVYRPVGANTNDVPYVHLKGIVNGNILTGIMLRSLTTDADGASGCVFIENDGDIPTSNHWEDLQSEYCHPPEGGSVVNCEGEHNEFRGYTDFDSQPAPDETQNTCMIRFVGDGNVLDTGILPVGYAGISSPAWHMPAFGVIIEGNGSRVVGQGNYQGNVCLRNGAADNHVHIAGATNKLGVDYPFVVDQSADPSNEIIVSPFDLHKSGGVTRTHGNAAPTTGTWNVGDVCGHADAASGEPMGWQCTVAGTFSAATDNTGDTDGATGVITGLTDTSDFFVGQYATVSAGFATTGPYLILAITATTMTLDTASNSAQSNITVSTTDPTFVAQANLA